MLKETTTNTKEIDNTLWAAYNWWYSLHKSAAAGLCVVVNHICYTAAGTITWSQSTRESSSVLSFSFHQRCRNPAPYPLEEADVRHSLLYAPLCLLACSSWAQCPLLRSHTLLCARLLAALSSSRRCSTWLAASLMLMSTAKRGLAILFFSGLM